jgi:hypothetical protein
MYGSLELPRLMALPAATKELSPKREMLSAISLSLSLSKLSLGSLYKSVEFIKIPNGR